MISKMAGTRAKEQQQPFADDDAEREGQKRSRDVEKKNDLCSGRRVAGGPQNNSINSTINPTVNSKINTINTINRTTNTISSTSTDWVEDTNDGDEEEDGIREAVRGHPLVKHYGQQRKTRAGNVGDPPTLLPGEELTALTEDEMSSVREKLEDFVRGNPERAKR